MIRYFHLSSICNIVGRHFVLMSVKINMTQNVQEIANEPSDKKELNVTSLNSE